MGLFENTSYTKGLFTAIEVRRKQLGRLTLAEVASAIGIQPSYLTNVLKGRSHFSSDQLYAACEYLNLEESETDYLLLLLEYERTGLARRKRDLEARIKQIQAQHRRTEKQLAAKPVELSPRQMEQYYLDPFCVLAHVYLSFYRRLDAPERFRRDFGLQVNHVARLFETLEQIGYIARAEDGFELKVRGRHLPKDSPMCGPHLALMRLKSVDQLQRLTEDQKYSFSATVSTTPETRDKIQAAFVRFLKEAESFVRESDSGAMYQINFDLFPWVTP